MTISSPAGLRIATQIEIACSELALRAIEVRAYEQRIRVSMKSGEPTRDPVWNHDLSAPGDAVGESLCDVPRDRVDFELRTV